MVDVSSKAETVREAVATAVLVMKPATLAAIRAGQVKKGDVLGVARTAGILAAKRTPDLIPLCHPLRITGVDVSFATASRPASLTIEARVRTVDKTGVEMEALTAVAIAALTVYDMVKAVEKGVTIAAIGLQEKRGGKSGHWIRDGGPDGSGSGPTAGRSSASASARRSRRRAEPLDPSPARRTRS